VKVALGGAGRRSLAGALSLPSFHAPKRTASSPITAGTAANARSLGSCDIPTLGATNPDALHAPLFMPVSALMGLDLMKAGYAHAIESGYRFYSYGDAPLLLPRSAFR
jgi:hypothetical protein